MECPNCKTNRMTSVELEEALQAGSCADCGGHWIQSFNYWKWRNQHGATLPEKTPELEPELRDQLDPKCCPECGKLLSRFKVGHGTGFHIERCANCAGMWFDRNEWLALKERNLHDEIHFIFGQPWQRAVREEAMEAVVTGRLREILGEDRFTEVENLKRWLDTDAQRGPILAWLNQG